MRASLAKGCLLNSTAKSLDGLISQNLSRIHEKKPPEAYGSGIFSPLITDMIMAKILRVYCLTNHPPQNCEYELALSMPNYSAWLKVHLNICWL